MIAFGIQFTPVILEQIFDDLLGILVDAVLLGFFVNGVVVVLGGRLEDADVGISVVV